MIKGLLLTALVAGLLAMQEQQETGSARQIAGDNSPAEFLERLPGKWQGTCRTWQGPDRLIDESEISGEFAKVLNGKFLRHTYEGTIQNRPRTGEELIAFNNIKKTFQISWIDSFHMNYAIMFSEGKPTENGFSVRGEYDVGEDQPPWGWRTDYDLQDDQLTITAYNILPDGTEVKAVETVCKRVR